MPRPIQQFFPHRKNGGGLPEVVISGSPDEPPPEVLPPEPIMVPFPTEGAPDPYTIVIPPYPAPLPPAPPTLYAGEPPTVTVTATPLVETGLGMFGTVPLPRTEPSPRAPPRRTRPPPKTRPRRPVKPPFRPRIPIPVPALIPKPVGFARVIGSVLTGLFGPVADAIGLLLYSGNAGPPNESELLLPYLVPPPKPEPDVGGLPEPVPFAPPTTEIPGVTITAPRPFAPPAPFATPLVDPGVIPPELPALGIPPVPGVKPQPVPRPSPRPGPSPLTPPIPLEALGLKPPPTPRKPDKPPLLGFVSVPGPSPVPEPDPCKECKRKEDQKKKQKKKPREKCFKGTYYERRNGLTKYKREEIPCR
jgi:hypothetical protein